MTLYDILRAHHCAPGTTGTRPGLRGATIRASVCSFAGESPRMAWRYSYGDGEWHVYCHGPDDLLADDWVDVTPPQETRRRAA